MSKVYYRHLDSPLGPLLIFGNGEAITGLYMRKQRHGRGIQPGWKRDDAQFEEAASQLAAYFAGELKQFDLLLAPAGTAFQLRVWQALRQIDYGRTESYGQLAARIAAPAASRAVGAANGRNPIGIIVPCHRVIGANGSLTGYGGGLARKQWLLAHEGAGEPGPVQTELF